MRAGRHRQAQASSVRTPLHILEARARRRTSTQTHTQHVCMCTHAFAQDGREYLREAKAATAVLGGVDAMIALVRRINKRYQDLVRQID